MKTPKKSDKKPTKKSAASGAKKLNAKPVDTKARNRFADDDDDDDFDVPMDDLGFEDLKYDDDDDF